MVNSLGLYELGSGVEEQISLMSSESKVMSSGMKRRSKRVADNSYSVPSQSS